MPYHFPTTAPWLLQQSTLIVLLYPPCVTGRCAARLSEHGTVQVQQSISMDAGAGQPTVLYLQPSSRGAKRDMTPQGFHYFFIARVTRLLAVALMNLGRQ